MKKEYGLIEAIYGATESGESFIAVRDGEVSSNTVFGKPEESGIVYVGFMMDAAGDFPVKERNLEPNVEQVVAE